MPDDLKKLGFDSETLKEIISGKLEEVKAAEGKNGGVQRLVDYLDATLEWEEFHEEQNQGEKP